MGVRFVRFRESVSGRTVEKIFRDRVWDLEKGFKDCVWGLEKWFKLCGFRVYEFEEGLRGLGCRV